MKAIQLLTLFLFLGQFTLAQDISTVKLSEIEARLDAGKDTTYVVNFWATWCAPCIKELPLFEAMNNSDRANTKVILVSLDFPEHLNSKLIPFVTERGVKSEVVILNENDDNVWIPQVSDEWSGSIPATLFVNQSKKTRHFHEGSFKEGELEALLKKLGL